MLDFLSLGMSKGYTQLGQRLFELFKFQRLTILGDADKHLQYLRLWKRNLEISTEINELTFLHFRLVAKLAELDSLLDVLFAVELVYFVQSELLFLIFGQLLIQKLLEYAWFGLVSIWIW